MWVCVNVLTLSSLIATIILSKQGSEPRLGLMSAKSSNALPALVSSSPMSVGLNPTNYTPETGMRSTQQFSITLPNEMAELVRAKVAAGEYATESEVIREGLRALLAQDRAVERWLKDQVGPAFDALKANPSRAVEIKSVRARLTAEHEKLSNSN